MAPRPKTQEASENQYWDKFHCTVSRKGKVNEAGQMKGVTISVTAQKLLRTKVPASESTINNLNTANDHQNPLGNDSPMITYYFPMGKVKEGDTMKANDVFRTINSIDDETGEEITVKSKTDIVGIKIHYDKKRIGYDEETGKELWGNPKAKAEEVK